MGSYREAVDAFLNGLIELQRSLRMNISCAQNMVRLQRATGAERESSRVRPLRME